MEKAEFRKTCHQNSWKFFKPTWEQKIIAKLECGAFSSLIFFKIQMNSGNLFLIDKHNFCSFIINYVVVI